MKIDELRNVQVTGLDTLAGEYEAMVRQWNFSSELTGDIIMPLQGSGWRGFAAETAAENIAKIRNEIDAAFEEASGIAQTLRDAHTEITAARADLEAAIRSATDQKLTVDNDGTVHWPPATTPEEKKDPDYAGSYRQKATDAAEAITKALSRAAEADAAAAAALAADTGSDRKAFNKKPVGGVSEQEAKQAVDLMRLGDKATPAQIAQLNALLKAHSSDPRFASLFFDSMGPDGFLKSYGQLALASADMGGDRPKAIADLQANLGTALATATSTSTNPHLSDEWEAGLRKAGSTRFDIWPAGTPGGGARPYGYQILTNILRTGTYDPHFLNPVAEHVTQLSQRPGFWSPDLWNAKEFNQLKYLGAQQGGFNPMAGVLEALGRNPKAALQFFHDPATIYDIDGTIKAVGQPNKYVQVLTAAGDRSPLQDVWKGHEFSNHAESAEVTALGHALEAATLGRVHDATGAPLPSHSPEMAKVMKDVVDQLGQGDGPKLLGKGRELAGLDASLGHMTAAYMGDVQHAVAPLDKTLPTYGAAANLDQANTEKLLGALGRNPESYGAIAQAQQAYTTAHIQDVMHHRGEYKELFGDAVKNAVHPGGVVAGILTAAMTDEVYVQKQAEADAYNKSIDQNAIWAKSIWAVTGGKVVSGIPVLGSGMSYPVNGFIDSIAKTYHMDSHPTDPATAAYDSGRNAAAAAAQTAVETAGQAAGLEQTYLDTLAMSTANQVHDAVSNGSTLFERALRG